MAKVKFTQALFDKICLELSHSDNGLVSLCKENDIHVSTFYEWISKEKALSDKYACAREMQAEFLADQILSIADDTSNDDITTETGEIPNHEWIGRSRLRIDARKWAASKLYPKKYGDKMDVTSGGEKLNSPVIIEPGKPASE